MIRDEIIIKNCVVWNKGDGVDDETWNERPIEDALQQKYDLLLAGIKAAMEDIRAYQEVGKPLLAFSELAAGADKAYENSLECIRKHIKEAE